VAVPWVQIVSLMPSILDVSRELLKRTRKLPASPAEPDGKFEDDPVAAAQARIRRLEENERRQAELVTTMADQLAKLTNAAAALHKVTRWLIVGQAVTAAIAIAAIVVALR
jgi:hypothetical protein